MRMYKIAAMGGDGIGPEVVEAGEIGRRKVLLRPDDLCAQLGAGREIGSDNVAVQRSGMRGKGASARHCPLAEHL